MSFDKTSSDPSIQSQPSPKTTPQKTPVESPKESGKYSSGAPKDNSMTRTTPVAGAKVYRD